MDISRIPHIRYTDADNFFLFDAPCTIESKEIALRTVEKIVIITNTLKIPYTFKRIFKKVNRSRIDSFIGIGDEKTLKILRKVSKTFYVLTNCYRHS